MATMMYDDTLIDNLHTCTHTHIYKRTKLIYSTTYTDTDVIRICTNITITDIHSLTH